MSILSGCECYDTCMRAIDQGTRLIKFYPSTKVPPFLLKEILRCINNRCRDKGIDMDELRLFVAGSVKVSDLKPYLDAGGWVLGYEQ